MAPNPDQYTPPIQAVDLPIFPIVTLPSEMLTYIASQIDDLASFHSFRDTCTVFRTVVEDMLNAEYNGFITSEKPKLSDNFYARLRINKNLYGIEIPVPGTTEWEELKANPLPIEQLQGDARQIALITNLYIKAWNLLLRLDIPTNPQQASKLMRLLLELLPHIRNAEGYAAKLFHKSFPSSIFNELANIHLDRCLQLVIRCWKFDLKENEASAFITKHCFNLIDLEQIRKIKRFPDQSFLSLVLQKLFSNPEIEKVKELLNVFFAYGYQPEQTDEKNKKVLSKGLNKLLCHIETKKSVTAYFGQLILLFLESGADCNALSQANNTALIVLCQYFPAELGKSIISLLLKHPEINVNARNRYGKGPVYLNMQNKGNVISRTGMGALEYLIQKNEFSIMQVLLRHPHISQSTLTTALRFAIQKNNLLAIQELLNCNKIERNTLLQLFNEAVIARGKKEMEKTFLETMGNQFIQEALALAQEKEQEGVAQFSHEEYKAEGQPTHKRTREEFESKTSS
jgi:hypothetical protein